MTRRLTGLSAVTLRVLADDAAAELALLERDHPARLAQARNEDERREAALDLNEQRLTVAEIARQLALREAGDRMHARRLAKDSGVLL